MFSKNTREWFFDEKKISIRINEYKAALTPMILKL